MKHMHEFLVVFRNRL